MRTLVALIAGLVFGAGLAVSQMMDPAKVLGFLDFGGIATGTWDPSLALVMGGALLVAAPAYFVARKLGRPFLSTRLQIPRRRDIDRSLVAGALLFGAGWGLIGFCPGPAVAALGTGMGTVFVFFAAMMAGMGLHAFFARRSAATPASTTGLATDAT